MLEQLTLLMVGIGSLMTLLMWPIQISVGLLIVYNNKQKTVRVLIARGKCGIYELTRTYYEKEMELKILCENQKS